MQNNNGIKLAEIKNIAGVLTCIEHGPVGPCIICKEPWCTACYPPEIGVRERCPNCEQKAAERKDDTQIHIDMIVQYGREVASAHIATTDEDQQRWVDAADKTMRRMCEMLYRGCGGPRRTRWHHEADQHREDLLAAVQLRELAPAINKVLGE